MPIRQLLLSLLSLLWLAGCTFRSDVLLPDAKAGGDPVAGFSVDAPTKVEGLDTETMAFKHMGLVTPEKVGGKVRYILSMPEANGETLVFQAKKLTEGNYLVRYVETKPGVEPEIRNGALLFLHIDKGVYHFLLTLSDRTVLDTIYAGGQAPSRPDSYTVRFDTIEQAERLSAYFRDHFAEFPAKENYMSVRIEK